MKQRKDKAYDQKLKEDELMDLVSLSNDSTGLGDIVIWVGPNSLTGELRIKVSNLPFKKHYLDCFTITLPDFKVIGRVNPAMVASSDLDKIKEWCILNLQTIEEYANNETSTNALIDKLKPLPEKRGS